MVCDTGDFLLGETHLHPLTRRKFVQATGAGAAVLISQRGALTAGMSSRSHDLKDGNPLNEFGYSKASLALKAAETQHSDLVAVTCGSLVLVAISPGVPKDGRAQLVAGRYRSGAGIDYLQCGWWPAVTTMVGEQGWDLHKLHDSCGLSGLMNDAG